MLRFAFLILALLLPSTTLLAQSHQGYRLLRLDGRLVKWSSRELGAGADITYAFISQDTTFDDARNCGSMKPIKALASEASVDQAALEAQAAAAFSAWSAAANVTFTKIDDAAAADILIGMDADPRGSAHTDVLPTADDGPVAEIRRGLICLSVNQAWKVGFSGDEDAQDLRYTFLHEIGHALGLDHPGPHGEVMAFTYGEEFSALQPGDVAGADALYGPHKAPASTVASATDEASAGGGL